MTYRIPFNRPGLAGNETRYVMEAVASGHISGDGMFTRRCHELLESTLGVAKALLTTSCTHALEMSALLLNIQPGDEVIVPTFTFVSTINAFVLRGAKPVFIDSRPDTLNLDETRLEAAITPRTRAILVVHYAGVGCEMDVINAVAARYAVPVIEDNAHGLFGKYKGRNLGTFGTMSVQSFHETKNFSCGEGGAILFNDPSWIERAEILREKGTDRSRFFRGQVDKYSWVDVGSSYLPSELLAAFLYAQLEARESIQSKRQQIWETYNLNLSDWAHQNQTRLPVIPESCEQPYHLYYLLLPSATVRQRLIDHLRTHEILAVFHYLPLHNSSMGHRFGGKTGDCPVAEDVSDRLLRLPLFTDLSYDDQCYVINAIHEFSV